MEKITYITQEDTKKQYKKILDQILEEHTKENFPELSDTPSQDYAIMAYQKENLLGGISFQQVYDTVHVAALAVKLSYRNSSIGSSLMNEMEMFCLKKNIRMVTVSTLSYQALGFYQKLEYRIFGQIEDYPFQGTTKYYLLKHLK